MKKDWPVEIGSVGPSPSKGQRIHDDHEDAARGSDRHAEGLPTLRELAAVTPRPLADSSQMHLLHPGCFCNSRYCVSSPTSCECFPFVYTFTCPARSRTARRGQQ